MKPYKRQRISTLALLAAMGISAVTMGSTALAAGPTTSYADEISNTRTMMESYKDNGSNINKTYKNNHKKLNKKNKKGMGKITS